ncbi:MAG TPA: S9 family peptidase [Steroidobacteraceae bacterium]|nr:S9 family peptidase [Steroidobacteraceae bacterium]
MRIGLAGLVALGCPLFALAAEPPPIERFTNFPQFQSLKISPHGQYLAFTRRQNGRESIAILHYPDLKTSAYTTFGDETDIASFRWAGDKFLLIEPARVFPGYNSYKAPTGEIIRLDANGKDAELLFGYQAGVMQTGTHITKRQSVEAAGSVIGTIPGNERDVLMQTYGYGIEGDVNAVYRMNLNTGVLSKVVGSPLRNGTFIIDSAYNVALVYGHDREGSNEVFRLGPKHQWERLVSTAPLRATLIPVGPTGAPDEFLVIDDRDAPTAGVFRWSAASGAEQLLYRNKDVDTEPLGVDPHNKPWGFVYVDHFPEYWYPDPQHPLAQAHQWLRSLFKGHNVQITSETDDMSYAVAVISAPRTPPVFIVVDVKNHKLLQHLVAYPDIKVDELGDAYPIEFVARDGLKIRGYLTVPHGVPQKKLPMIVLVHGGPHGVYDAWDFDWEAQLFASRGYAVLQVNYRGSGGRGRDFEDAGFGRWGREMQDDITDGVRWAIGDGVADAKRICIYGGSYGAYAALTGAFREPDMFRCAVGLAGVYDLPLMFERGDIQSVESGVTYLKAAVGTDTEELKRRSPVYNADKIRAAVLLLHGKIDERAPYEHAVRMRDALTKAGNPPEWFTEWGEGHGFFDEKHRVEAYERILAFFEKHLGKPAATAQN